MEMLESKLIQSALNEYQKILGSLEKKSPEYPNIGSPPSSLVVRQIRQYKAEGMCLGDTIAAWKVTEKSIEKLSDYSIELERELLDGMYYKEGCADFSISPDSKKIIIEWQVGPRYGRGWRYEIVIEDSNVILKKEADLWVS